MNAKKDYKNCLHAMYSLRRFGIKLGLSTIRRILEELGNPQDHFGCIHVAGTNGKGSIASGIASILNAAGYRTGRIAIADAAMVPTAQAAKIVISGHRASGIAIAYIA